MYENAALLDKPVIDVVASIAEKHAVPRAHVAIAGCYQNPSSQHRSLAQRNQNIFPRLSARWTFHLAMPKSRNWKFAICRTPLTGSFPASGYAAFPHAAFSDPELLTPCPGPALPGLPDHSFPVTDVKRKRCRRECARSKNHRSTGFGPAVSDNKQLAMPGADRRACRFKVTAFVAVRQHNLPNRQSVAVEDHDAALA